MIRRNLRREEARRRIADARYSRREGADVGDINLRQSAPLGRKENATPIRSRFIVQEDGLAVPGDNKVREAIAVVVSCGATIPFAFEVFEARTRRSVAEVQIL